MQVCRIYDSCGLGGGEIWSWMEGQLCDNCELVVGEIWLRCFWNWKVVKYKVLFGNGVKGWKEEREGWKIERELQV